MSLGNIQREHWRIAILRLLADQAEGYSANESILADALPLVGVSPSRDQVKSELSWLQDQGLVSLVQGSGPAVVILSSRGLDVAGGKASVPGVKRPSPDAIMRAAARSAQNILGG